MRRYLFLLALLALPLLEGGNSALGQLIGLALIPLLFAWETASGGLRISWKALAAWAAFIAFALITTSYLYPTLKMALWLICAACAYSLASHYLQMRKLGGVDIALTMAVSALLTALYGLFEYAPNLRQFTPGAHVVSFFGLHNSYAAFLLLTWPLAVAVIRRGRRQSFILAAAVMLVAFLLTFSRAAYIAFALQIMLLAWLGLRSYLRGRKGATEASGDKKPSKALLPMTLSSLGILAALVIMLAFTSVPASIAARIGSIWNAADYSLQGRLTFWAVSWKMFLKFPVQGAGLGDFGYHYTYLQPDWRYYTTDPHSFIFQALAETGLIGLIFIAVLIWWGVKRLVLAAKNVPAASKWAHSLMLIALAGFTAHALVDFDFTYFANMAFFAVILAIAHYPALGELQEGVTSRPWLRIAAVCALAVAVLGTLYASEKSQLSQGERDEGALAKAARLIPWNAATQIDLALASLSKMPPDFDAAAGYAAQAGLRNEWESQAAFILSQCPNAAELEERISLGTKALQIDPYNRPQYYWGLARLLRQKGDAKSEETILLTAAQHYTGITGPIGPDFPRPNWMENNITFASIYSRLAELLKESQPTAAVLYSQLARGFRGAPPLGGS